MTPKVHAALVGNDPGRCPCGRLHPSTGRRRALRKPEEGLPLRAFEAFTEGKATRDLDGRWRLRYAGRCERPLELKANDAKSCFATRLVRCRRCGPCRRARQARWALASANQCSRAKGRTWFGTLTLDSDWQSKFLQRAQSLSGDPLAAWWWEENCDARFKAVTDVVYGEVQKYWKRLRKAGNVFTYVVVFERHKTGLPHMHFLLHEQGEPILKRSIQEQWPFGFSNVKLVGAKRGRTAEQASWYVAKYLAKSLLARVRASRGYRPEGQ